jgi:hypothetical protein
MYGGTAPGNAETTIRTESLKESAAASAMLLKAQGHYTLADWRRLIDSTWGPGPSTVWQPYSR